MTIQSHTRYSLIQNYINRWLGLPGLTRTILTDRVVTAFNDLHLDHILNDHGVKFKTTNCMNCEEPMRVNAQKFFRWLGFKGEQYQSEEKILHLEPAIVAAMPNDIKIAYLNEVYAGTGVYIGVRQGDEPDLEGNGGGCIYKMVASITKENSEAQVAVVQLGSNPTADQIKETYRELKESAGTTLGAIDFFEQKFSNIFKKRSRSNWAKTA